MYYDPEQNKPILGHCFFTCFSITKGVTVTNTSTFNADMCSNMFNRQGRFCGECKEGHGLLRKSTCLECMYCLLQLFIHWCIIILCLVAKLLFIIIALFISSSIVTKYLFILDALL